jgi:hypothetical protein
MMKYSVKNAFHLSGGVNTVPLSVLFQYKTLRENEIKGKGDYQKQISHADVSCPEQLKGCPLPLNYPALLELSLYFK